MKNVCGMNNDDACKIHNIYRQLHSSGEIKLDPKLCQDAENHAKLLAEKNKAFHATNIQDGENIFTIKGGGVNGKIVTDCWYNEFKKYNFAYPSFSPKTGHFTQLVWKKCNKFGYGEAKSSTGTIFVVCRYSPAGNVDGEYDENVLPPIQQIIKEGAPTIEGLSADESLVLQSHNRYRRKHDVSPLTWSPELKDIAEKRIKLYIDAKNSLEVPKIVEYGENVSIVDGIDVDGNIIVNSWYHDGFLYDYNDPHPHTGFHHTQLIWKSTSELGYFKQQMDEKDWLYVAIYHPKGNVDGEYIENVLPPVCPTKEEVKDETDEQKLKKAVLNKHNEIRAKHDALPLLWSNTLEKEAGKWVEYLLTNESISKDTNSRRGQNIGYEWEKETNEERIIEKWYSQEICYDYRDPKRSIRTESFTQLVWLFTRYVGFAVGSHQGVTIYVALYWPPGNINGLFSENVLMRNISIPASISADIDYRNLMVKHHNIYRIRHRSKKLKLSDTLSLKADDIARRTLKIVSGDRNFGFYAKSDVLFNYLFTSQTEFPHPNIICQVWYSTGIHFEYDSEQIEPESQPFCEMLWKTTKKIGVAAVKVKNVSAIVVVYGRTIKDKEKVGNFIKRPIEQYETLKNGS